MLIFAPVGCLNANTVVMAFTRGIVGAARFCHPFPAGSHPRSMVATNSKSRHTPCTFIYPVVRVAISKPQYRYPKRIPTLLAAIACFKLLTNFSANQPEFRRLLEGTLAPLEVWSLISQHCDNLRWRCWSTHSTVTRVYCCA